MFDIGWSEILLVVVVALVVVGPKDLPRLIRIVGQWVGKARRMADQFRASFDELTRETELDELRREIAALRGHNPVTRFHDEINRSIAPPGAAASAPSAPTEDVPVAPPTGSVLHDAAEPVLGSEETAGDARPAAAVRHGEAVPQSELLPPDATPTRPR